MTTLKKALSVVLCLAMLLGTFAVCVTADATTGVKSYAKLVSENTDKKFVYFGSDIFENYGVEGQALTDGTVCPGQVLHVKQYVKTNCTVGASTGSVTAISLMFDKAVFEIVSDSWTKYTGNPAGSYQIKDGENDYVSTSSTTAKSYFYGTDGKALKSVLDGKTALYSLDEVKGWTILRYENTEKDKASTKYATDDICFEFDIKVKTDAKAKTTGRSLAPATIYTGYQGGNATCTTNNFVLEKNLTTKKYDAWYNADSEHQFTVKNEKVKSTFVVGNDESYVEGAPEAAYPAGSVPALGDNYIGWVDSDGNLAEVSVFPDDSTTYTAVEKGTTVKVSLDIGENATIEGSKEFDVELGSIFNVVDYNSNKPVNTNSNLVYAWDNDGFKVDTINPITVKAIWSGEVNIKVMNLAGEFVTAMSIKGEPGTKFSYNDLVQVNDNYDVIKAAVNYKGEDKDPGNYDVVFDIKGSKALPLTTKAYQYLYATPDDAGSYLSATKAAEIVYGSETVTDLYIQTTIQYTVNKYKPVLDDDNIYIEGEWEIDKTETANFKWKIGSDPDTGVPYDHTKYTDDKVYNILDTQGNVLDAAITDPTFGMDTLICDVGTTGTDGKGVDVPIIEGKYMLTQANADEGTQTINVYPKVSKKAYGVVINVNGTDMSSESKVVYGSEATVSDFDKVGYYKISNMKVDAGSAYYGKKLVGLYLSSDESKENNLLDAGKIITFDADTITANLKNGTNNIILVPEWADGEYSIEFFYMDSNAEWKSLFTKTYVGDTAVSFNDIPEDLQKKVNDEMPEGRVLDLTYGITAEPGEKAKFKYTSGKAYAEGKMKAYVAYKLDQITYYHIYNENAYGVDEEGKSTAAAGINYESVVLDYGTVLYNPNYDPESATTKPVYNGLVDGTAIASDPDIKKSTLEDGTEKISDIKGDLTATKRPYRNCEYIGYKVYYVEGNYSSIADLPSKDKWIEGFNSNEGDYALKNTVIFERQWKADKDFLVRVYGVNENNETKIYMGIGKDFSKYYWKGDRVVETGDGELVAFEGYFAMGFMPKLDNFDIERFFDPTMWAEVSLRVDVISMSKDLLNPAEWGKILAAAFTAIKNLL